MEYDLDKEFILRKESNLLFNQATGFQHKLNESATEIISLLFEGFSVYEASMQMSKKYQVPVDIIEQDIFELLSSIKSPVNLSNNEFEKDSNVPPLFPFAVEVELTKLCNWNCKFCYNLWKDKTQSQSQTERADRHFDKIRLFEILRECKENNVFRIRYSGGEPTMHPDFTEIVEYGSSLGLYQVVFTNGQSLVQNDDSVSWYKSNLKEVLISLHGNKETHDTICGKEGAYQQAVNAITNCIDANLKVIVEMTLTLQNFDFIFHVIDLVKALGVKEFRLMRFVPNGKNDDLYSVPYPLILDLIEKLNDTYCNTNINIKMPCSPKFCLSEKNAPISDKTIINKRSKFLLQHCKAGINWISLSYDGKLRICPHSNMNFSDVRFMGTSIKDAWHTLVRNEVISKIQKKPKSCYNCKAWTKCLGGCYLNEFTA